MAGDHGTTPFDYYELASKESRIKKEESK